MAILKCKMCGGDLDICEGITVAECEYCGTKQTVPSADDEKKISLFARANRLRFACEFDKAAGVYESIVVDFPEEAEAYWGLVLCKYGIEYVDDPATAKKIPTCHRSSFDSVMDDGNFDMVMENADSTARSVYREEAKQIEELRKAIIEVSTKEEPYDIFICYKETAENGDRTIDSVIAQDVYDELTSKGYRVFFSRITLEDKLGQEYEPYIFAALNSAKIMLAFGSDYEYYNAVWVKNEWSRFLQLISKGEKKTLIPCYKDIDAYDMPKEFAKLQAQDMGKVGAIQDLLRGIEKILPKATAKTETVVIQQSANNPTVDSLLKRVFIFLEDEEWETADEYCEKVLDIDPECAEAYLGKLMAELKVKKRSYLNFLPTGFSNSKNYEKIIRYGSEALVSELNEYLKYVAFGLKIEDGVLKECDKNVTSITIPEGVISIGDYAFYDCSNLTSVTISNDVKSIGKNAFMDCVNLSSITIPEGVTNIGDSAFYNCHSLNSVLILDSVTSIGDDAFNCCSNLTAITIPDSVISIGDRAFSRCSKLASFTIPKSVTNIGDWVFNDCSSLSSIIIPDGVTNIGELAFSGCSNLTSVTIPESVTNIGNSAFEGCSNLSSVTIPKGVTSIGEWTFSGCSNLASIIIPEGVTSIGMFAFSECSSLVSVDVPESVTFIADNAFAPNVEIIIHAPKLNVIEEEKAYRRTQNLCQYCGGSFKGAFTKKCSLCGKEKDY